MIAAMADISVIRIITENILHKFLERKTVKNWGKWQFKQEINRVLLSRLLLISLHRLDRTKSAILTSPVSLYTSVVKIGNEAP